MVEHRESNTRFRILVCLDGSDEGYRGLRYGAKLSGGNTADICLLHLRSADSSPPQDAGELPADANLFDFDKKVPGVKYMTKARQILGELGILTDAWTLTCQHEGLADDPIGNNRATFTHGASTITFKHEVANNIADGILAEIDACQIDLAILGASDRWRKGTVRTFWDPIVAEKVAKQAPCSVLVARDLEIGRGHLLCTDGSDKAAAMIVKDAALASRCQCPVSLISVAHDEAEKLDAERHVENATQSLKALNIDVVETMVRIGEPEHEIVEAGPDYSLIVLSASSASGLKQFFIGSTAYKIMEEAYNSVMIVR